MLKFFLVVYVLFPGSESITLDRIEVTSRAECFTLAPTVEESYYTPAEHRDMLAAMPHMFGVACVTRYDRADPA